MARFDVIYLIYLMLAVCVLQRIFLFLHKCYDMQEMRVTSENCPGIRWTSSKRLVSDRFFNYEATISCPVHQFTVPKLKIGYS